MSVVGSAVNGEQNPRILVKNPLTGDFSRSDLDYCPLEKHVFAVLKNGSILLFYPCEVHVSCDLYDNS